jgi:hypothetical protein
MLLCGKLHSQRNQRRDLCVPHLVLTVTNRWNHVRRTIKLNSATASNFVANLKCRTAKWRVPRDWIGLPYDTTYYEPQIQAQLSQIPYRHLSLRTKTTAMTGNEHTLKISLIIKSFNNEKFRCCGICNYERQLR